jgi:uncharacterized membrane protein (UPF0127 family)
MRSLMAVVVIAMLAFAGCGSMVDSPESSACAGYETVGDVEDTATVRVIDSNGSRLGTVDARVADSPREHCIGLSETESLQPDEGMLFVFDEAAPRTFVMRDMAFPLDIIFVAGNGTITRIHSAPTEDPPLTEYEGLGRYVLEVPRGWAVENGVEVGDRVVVEFEEP